MIAKHTMPMTGVMYISSAGRIEMNAIDTPASVPSSAARGVILRGGGWAELWVNSLWLWGLALAALFGVVTLLAGFTLTGVYMKEVAADAASAAAAFDSHTLDRVAPLDADPGERLAAQTRPRVAGVDAGLLGLELEQQVAAAVAVYVGCDAPSE